MLRINDMSNIIVGIYSKKNEEKSFEYMYSYLTRKTAYLTREFIRDGNQDKELLKNTYIEALSWLFAICDKLEIQPQEAFYKKFPSCCPYCLGAPCSCSQTHRKPEKIRSAKGIKDELFNKYNAIKPMQFPPYAPRMINDIYPSNRTIWSTFGGFYHSSRLFEELGELQEAYAKSIEDKNYNKENLHEECADIYAWLFSLWGIIFKDDDLGEAFESYYLNGCPVCNKRECVCVSYSGKISKTDEKRASLEKLKQELELLLKDETTGEFKENLESAISAIKDAIDSGKDADSRRTLSEVESVLDSIEKNSAKMSSVASNALNVFNVISKLF
ncbi:MazG-like family protein [Escherichia coli]|nr:MazG-like family protein [Escherichia coli]MDM1561332.1 hypothetical protein [Escherichia coli]MDM1634598.1 hypothetical protein [Escherichia coli]MDM1648643.1 hypothetical protein [Escherichia coli]MDM1668129.1 hypothetical protein [Escherichia coli]MDM1694042.1 hypothetical protein [Escherichia coli]